MKYKHNVSITEFYEMIPYERQIFLDLTTEHLLELEKLAQT
jgi:hypothetical protein